jgi:radical SAM superfamily enzyme YgiQ (UPF0313 family)
MMPCKILEYSGADFGIQGEGELSFPKLVEKIAAGKDYSDIPGLVHRSADGVISNPQSLV